MWRKRGAAEKCANVRAAARLGAAGAARLALLLLAHLVLPLVVGVGQRRLERVEVVARDPLDRVAVDAGAEHPHRLEGVARLARQVLVDREDEVDEALLDVGLHHLHHPEVVVDQPAARVAVVDGEVARMWVTMEEPVAAHLFTVCKKLF